MLNTKPLAKFVGAGMAFGLLIAAPATLAQDAVAPPAAPASEASSDDFSDETIAAFATAYVEVVRIGQDMQTELQTAETPEDQQAIMEEANTTIADTVEQTPGIAVEEYNEILNVAQTDDALIERINGALASMQPTDMAQ